MDTQIKEKGLVASKSETTGSTIFDRVGYAANLQQAIEYHCRGKIVPDALAKLCQYHAKMLNAHLSNAKITSGENREGVQHEQ